MMPSPPMLSPAHSILRRAPPRPAASSSSSSSSKRSLGALQAKLLPCTPLLAFHVATQNARACTSSHPSPFPFLQAQKARQGCPRASHDAAFAEPGEPCHPRRSRSALCDGERPRGCVGKGFVHRLPPSLPSSFLSSPGGVPVSHGCRHLSRSCPHLRQPAGVSAAFAYTCSGRPI